jgi:hypothetical protein
MNRYVLYYPSMHWITFGEASTQFAITRNQVRYAVKQKRLRVKKQGYNAYLYNVSDLHKLAQSKSTS